MNYSKFCAKVMLPIENAKKNICDCGFLFWVFEFHGFVAIKIIHNIELSQLILIVSDTLC
jgi:hypothetical protein